MNRNYYSKERNYTGSYSVFEASYDNDTRLGFFANAALTGLAAALLFASVIAVVFISAVTGWGYILSSLIMFAVDALVMLSAVKMTKAFKIWKINRQQPAIRWA